MIRQTLRAHTTCMYKYSALSPETSRKGRGGRGPKIKFVPKYTPVDPTSTQDLLFLVCNSKWVNIERDHHFPKLLFVCRPNGRFNIRFDRTNSKKTKQKKELGRRGKNRWSRHWGAILDSSASAATGKKKGIPPRLFAIQSERWTR